MMDQGHYRLLHLQRACHRRAYVPQQDLSTGPLQVLVVEGKLEGYDRRRNRQTL